MRVPPRPAERVIPDLSLVAERARSRVNLLRNRERRPPELFLPLNGSDPRWRQVSAKAAGGVEPVLGKRAEEYPNRDRHGSTELVVRPFDKLRVPSSVEGQAHHPELCRWAEVRGDAEPVPWTREVRRR